ncbi:ribosomal protein L19 (plastid) [Cryptomonas paramecium]|uniref:Ribosomal protein L19 n=1 Tax=Cryptomonas paramaecium TaxID=2898 RepID=D2ISC5_9CRYP|nr:ribosomal protein L19 [Cryptomonas paramecium]ACT46817.1 ribosomal protein L19 [Cryptomonas paramecium]BDA97978.1 ribosomal protein L19 [Cryptomonas paramecium]
MLLNIIEELKAAFLVPALVKVRVGDTVKILVSWSEGPKEKSHSVEGLVVAIKHSGLDKTVTLRRIIHGVGVDRVYFLSSPRLKSVEVVATSKVRRSKLYYLRSKFGKDARLPQKFS